MSSIHILDVIRTKRDGGELSDEQIRWFIEGYTADRIAHEQASALLMAIVWRSMNPRELATWTDAMLASGVRLDLSGVGRPTVDKHSTGGVGDKISLPLTPVVAACGAAVPQLAGRGLGHTGGTLDKLEAIPGWRFSLSGAEMLDQLRTVGAMIAGAGDDVAPADRKLYALRDITATVESIPLIASSIMSKKIAEGTDALVLDVKVGSGAFMTDVDSARTLARTMVDLGDAHGMRCAALLTDMDTPLGLTAGNALEVRESVEVLSGGGPADVVELTVTLARAMLEMAEVSGPDPADVLADGRAMDVWRRMITAQGGDVDADLPRASHVEELRAERDGYVTRLEARAIGEAAWLLGAGRSRKEDPVSAGAGIVWRVRPGDEVRRGQVVFELHADDPAQFDPARHAVAGALQIGDTPRAPRDLVIDRVD